MKKYIRFYITLGGDTGWRVTNGDEWCSLKFTLLFDASVWTMESIKNALDTIKKSIFHDRNKGSTLAEKGDCGAKYLNEFFTQNKGSIFTIDNNYPWGCKKTLPNLKVKNFEIEDWNYNGNNRNYN